MSAAEDLAREGYDGLFLAGDSSSASAVYAAHGEALRTLVADADAGDVERVLAAEVWYACGDGPPAPPEVLGPLYARALELTGSPDGPVVFYGNLWGTLMVGYDGPLAEHLIAQGEAAAPGLERLLDDEHDLVYVGSRDAMAGNAHGYKIKDAAAYFLERIRDAG
jgi:hypothetical protein